MLEDILIQIVAYAVEDLAWPFYNPHLLRKFQTLAIFAGIYGVAFLCNVQHWITGISNTDRSLDVVMNMKTRMNPVGVLSFTVIVVAVAARSLIILNLVSLFFLQMVEFWAQFAARNLVRIMKDRKERSGGKFQKQDVDNLRALMEAGAWAHEQLLEQSPGVNQLVNVIYERLGINPVEAYLVGNKVRIVG